MQPGRLAGKVAIVTGAASGIGRATALLLAREGAAVVVADVNGAGAAAVAKEIAAAGGRAVSQAADVADEASVVAMVEAAAKHFGGLDVLHNNAAASDPALMSRDGDVADMEIAVFDRTLAVNLRGPMLGCKHAIPRMLVRGGGSIVNTSSASALVGDPVRTAYGASKAGARFAHALRRHAVRQARHPLQLDRARRDRDARARGQRAARDDRDLRAQPPDAAARPPRGHRGRRRVPRLRRRRLHHRPDDQRGRRPARASPGVRRVPAARQAGNERDRRSPLGLRPLRRQPDAADVGALGRDAARGADHAPHAGLRVRRAPCGREGRVPRQRELLGARRLPRARRGGARGGELPRRDRPARAHAAAHADDAGVPAGPREEGRAVRARVHRREAHRARPAGRRRPRLRARHPPASGRDGARARHPHRRDRARRPLGLRAAAQHLARHEPYRAWRRPRRRVPRAGGVPRRADRVASQRSSIRRTT